MKDTLDQKTGIDSAAEQNSDDSSHGQVLGYIDPIKEAKMMRKFDVRNSATAYLGNPNAANLREYSSGQSVSSEFSTCWQTSTGQSCQRAPAIQNKPRQLLMLRSQEQHRKRTDCGPPR